MMMHPMAMEGRAPSLREMIPPTGVRTHYHHHYLDHYQYHYHYLGSELQQ